MGRVRFFVAAEVEIRKPARSRQLLGSPGLPPQKRRQYFHPRRPSVPSGSLRPEAASEARQMQPPAPQPSLYLTSSSSQHRYGRNGRFLRSRCVLAHLASRISHLAPRDPRLAVACAMTSVRGSPGDLESPGLITLPPYGGQRLPRDVAWPCGARSHLVAGADQLTGGQPNPSSQPHATPRPRFVRAMPHAPSRRLIYSVAGHLCTWAPPRNPFDQSVSPRHGVMRHSSRAARRQARRNVALAQLSNPSRRIGPLTHAPPRCPSNLHPAPFGPLPSSGYRLLRPLRDRVKFPPPPFNSATPPLGSQ